MYCLVKIAVIQPYITKRISSLPSVAGTSLRAHFAVLKSCTHKLVLYVGVRHKFEVNRILKYKKEM